MELADIREAIELMRYKPGSAIELAPVAGRLFNPEAGVLRIIVRLNLVPADDPTRNVQKTHTKVFPPAAHIRNRDHLLELVRMAIREAEAYENDQWLSLDGKYPYRRPAPGTSTNSN